jgi:hypothetical protein
VPTDSHWLIAIAFLAEICSTLGDTERAALLYDLLLPYADRLVTAGFTIVPGAVISWYLGLLAATLRRWAEACDHLQAAIEASDVLGAPLAAGAARVELARVLLSPDAGLAVDHSLVDRILDAAGAAAERAGSTRLLNAVAEVAPLRRVHPGAG